MTKKVIKESQDYVILKGLKKKGEIICLNNKKQAVLDWIIESFEKESSIIKKNNLKSKLEKNIFSNNIIDNEANELKNFFIFNEDIKKNPDQKVLLEDVQNVVEGKYSLEYDFKKNIIESVKIDGKMSENTKKEIKEFLKNFIYSCDNNLIIKIKGKEVELTPIDSR